MRERHVPHAEAREHPQRAERVFDRVPPFNPDQAGDLPGCEVACDVGGGRRHRQRTSIPRAETTNQVDLLECVDSRMGTRVHRGHGYIRRPELAADSSRAESRNVGHQLWLIDREIYRVESTALSNRVGDVVVTVDERNGVQNAEGLSTIILGGKWECWNDGQNHHHYPRSPSRPSNIPTFHRSLPFRPKS